MRLLFEESQDWLIGSDPGLLRLQSASRTILTLGVSLVVLYLLAMATGQSLSVALLGVLIATMSAAAFNDPDPRQQKITLALLPLPAAAATALGALLAPHRIAGDIVFVAIMFVAVYVRRFGSRGTALGMVAFMTYFFALFLGATVGQLPWLIGAVVVGTVCSFVMRSYVLPDHPDRVLRRTLRALWARVAAVVDAGGEALGAEQLDERQRRRLRSRVARLNETALMVESQIDGHADATAPWPNIRNDQLLLRLFDAQLAAERLATAAEQAAAAAGEIPTAARVALLKALGLLGAVVRARASNTALDRAGRDTDQLLNERAGSVGGEYLIQPEARQLALAIDTMLTATNRVRALAGAAPGRPAVAETDLLEAERNGIAGPLGAGAPPAANDHSTSLLARLRPTTRQAVQVAIASSLAIVAGELLSSARWYWAVITAFVIFSGTTSRGETLTKGWQRLLGTALGVPAGVLIATIVNGNTVWSLALIFVCMFCSFYFTQIAYSLMIFWTTTMLALLYGLLGQFTVGLLVLRIEETAIGAVIGVLVAILVLPSSTREAIRNNMLVFLTALGELVEAATRKRTDTSTTGDLAGQARQLDQQLQQLRTAAEPLTGGIAGVRGRGNARRAMRVLTGCDYYARNLARFRDQAEAPGADPAVWTAVERAAGQVRHNVNALTDLLDHRRHAAVCTATDLLDSAEQAATGHAGRPTAETSALLTVLHSLRGMDRAIVGLAHDLGAEAQTGRTDAHTGPVPAPPLRHVRRN